MGYRKDDIERLRASLAELPEMQSSEVSKQEAVRLLASTIHGLQEKGYRLDKIAELVSARGVAISATTLKSYLHRVKPRAKATGKPNRKQPSTPRDTERLHPTVENDSPRETEERTTKEKTVGTRNDASDGAALAGKEAKPTRAVASPETQTPASRNQPGVSGMATEGNATGAPADRRGAGGRPVSMDGVGAATSTVPAKTMVKPASTVRMQPVEPGKATFTPREDSDDI